MGRTKRGPPTCSGPFGIVGRRLPLWSGPLFLVQCFVFVVGAGNQAVDSPVYELGSDLEWVAAGNYDVGDLFWLDRAQTISHAQDLGGIDGEAGCWLFTPLDHGGGMQVSCLTTVKVNRVSALPTHGPDAPSVLRDRGIHCILSKYTTATSTGTYGAFIHRRIRTDDSLGGPPAGRGGLRD